MSTPKGKKFTVSEFQTWLDGIMEFQESGWSPSAEQWKAIYQKIQNLKEPPQSPRTVKVDASSISEIVDGIAQTIPDIGHVDFELMTNVLNAIFSQIRQGANFGQMPHSTPTNTGGSGQNMPLQRPPPVQGDDLANIPLSKLREQQVQLTGKPQGNSNLVVDDVKDEFV